MPKAKKQHQSVEFAIAQRYVPDLVVAVQGCLLAIGDKCLSEELISNDTYSSILGSNEIEGRKARRLLDAVRNCIKTNSEGLKVFIDILDEELPEKSKPFLEKMKNDLADRLKFQEDTECTDDKGGDTVAAPTSNPASDSTSEQPSVKASLVRRGKRLIGGDGQAIPPAQQHTTPVTGNEVQAPIPVSDADGAKPTFLPHISSPSARRRILKQAIELIQTADMDAQQDEAEKQQLRDENAKLKDESEKFKKALEREKQLKKQLEEMEDCLDDLKKQKVHRENELKRELEILHQRLADAETRGHHSQQSYEKLQSKLSKATSGYEKKIAAQEKKVEKQKERLTQQESIISEKERIVSDLTEEVKELSKENRKLVRENSNKDEKLAHEQRKRWNVQQRLEQIQRGFYCSSLAQLCVLWFLGIVLGLVILSVGIYKYMYPYDPNNSCSQ